MKRSGFVVVVADRPHRLSHGRRHRDFLPERDPDVLFQLYGVRNWQELEQVGRDHELLRIHLDMHLIDWNTIVKLSLKEQAEGVENVRAFIREVAEERGLSEGTVRNMLYRN